MLLRKLVELALALSFFLFWRHLRNNSLCFFVLHALSVALSDFRHLSVAWEKLVGRELVSRDPWLLLRQQLGVLCLLGKELSLNIVRLRALLHLTELMRQGFAGLVWL